MSLALFLRGLIEYTFRKGSITLSGNEKQLDYRVELVLRQ